MENNNIALAEIQLFQIHLKQRAIICYSMVFAAFGTLLAGIVMLYVGTAGDQIVWLESKSLKVTAGGFGAITMTASVLWGYFAYRSRPEIKYIGPKRSLHLTREEVERGERIQKMANEQSKADA
ncbi:hypothetical protein [Marinomonas sp. PE14-40]|uniref:hypothetical protein n=1 Tax=Marinomonas sp. PE14-40 TaxID=3060621 RepID=UPI003F66635A